MDGRGHPRWGSRPYAFAHLLLSHRYGTAFLQALVLDGAGNRVVSPGDPQSLT